MPTTRRRYNADGSLDTTFGSGGRVTTDFASGDDLATAGVVLLADGGIVTAGYTFNTPTGNDFALARYSADGVLDASCGRLATDFNGGADAGAGLLLQPDGKVVVAGESSHPSTGTDFALVRYDVQGSLSPGSLQFSVATFTVNENAGTVTITVTRTGGSGGSVTVLVATGKGTATADQDYTPVTQTLTFADGQTSATFTIAILDDFLLEGDETVTLMLSDPTGGATLGEQSTAVLTIVDNELAEAGELQFSAAAYVVDKAKASITITVTRSGGTTGEVTVDFATIDGTATAGKDYVAASGTLLFADGQTEATFTVTLLGDDIPEGNESFFVTLGNLTGGASLGPLSTAEVILVDPVQLADDGGVGFSTAGEWTSLPDQGLGADVTVSSPGDGSDAAAWTFTITPGVYRISATWPTQPDRATNAPFMIFDGDTFLALVLVNQELDPDDLLDGGIFWEDVGLFAITGDTLRVVLTDLADEFVIADAVRIERVS